MEKYLEKLVKEMELRGLAESSRVSYSRDVELFFNFISKVPEEADLNDIKDFLHHLQHRKSRVSIGKKISPNTVNRTASSLGFFFLHVLDKNYYGEIPRMKRPKYIPTILTVDEINSMMNSVYNVFWKAVVMTLYSTGMRQSELRNLKVQDIDSSRMVIYIRNGKGNKDRQASLSPILLDSLRAYWRKYRLKSVKSDYLFIPNKNSYNGVLKKSLSHTAVGYILKKAALVSGVKKKLLHTA